MIGNEDCDEENKKGGGGRQIGLIKLHNLKYNAHDKNYKMIWQLIV